jgi:hypothetical protein
MKGSHAAALLALAIGVGAAVYVLKDRYRYIEQRQDGLLLVSIRHDTWTGDECVWFSMNKYTKKTLASGRFSCACIDHGDCSLLEEVLIEDNKQNP